MLSSWLNHYDHPAIRPELRRAVVAHFKDDVGRRRLFDFGVRT